MDLTPWNPPSCPSLAPTVPFLRLLFPSSCCSSLHLLFLMCIVLLVSAKHFWSIFEIYGQFYPIIAASFRSHHQPPLYSPYSFSLWRKFIDFLQKMQPNPSHFGDFMPFSPSSRTQAFTLSQPFYVTVQIVFFNIQLFVLIISRYSHLLPSNRSEAASVQVDYESPLWA